MAQTTILAAGTTAANSSSVTVQDTPVKVSLFTTDNILHRCKLPLQEQVAGVWQNFYCEDTRVDERQPVYLTNTKRSYTIFSPGTYRVVRSLETNAVGAVSDDVS